MSRRSRSQKLVAEINITPFTDVILVLLIIFIVATPLIFRSSVQVDLPKSAAMKEPPTDINITINSGGLAFLNQQQYNLRFDLELLKFNLGRIAKTGSIATLVINGDRRVEYEFIMKVVEIASQLGIKSIALTTEFKK